MVLKVSGEQLELMRYALERERGRVIRDIAECHHLGRSPEAMELCRRRSAIEMLLDQIEKPEAFVAPSVAKQAEALPLQYAA